MATFFPFNFQPADVVELAAGSYVIPADKYAFVSAQANGGGEVTIDGTTWLEARTESDTHYFLRDFSNVDLQLAAGASFTVPDNYEYDVFWTYKILNNLPANKAVVFSVDGKGYFAVARSGDGTVKSEVSPYDGKLSSSVGIINTIAPDSFHATERRLVLGAGSIIKNEGAGSFLDANHEWVDADNTLHVWGSAREIGNNTTTFTNVANGSVWLKNGQTVAINVSGNAIITLFNNQ